jgi:hypothetical protein
MALELFKNNITTTLAIGINSSATTITVASGAGSNFPTLSGGNFFRAVLTSSAVPGSSYEYIIVTAVTGDNLTVIRGQEGVAAASWNAGDILYMSATAASDASFVQAADLSGYAPINSPTFTGNPAAPTPSQFDNDTSLATTQFVQKALGNFQAAAQLNANTTLTSANFGSIFQVTGNYTITLPSPVSVASGVALHLFSNSSNWTLAAPSGTSIIVGTSSGVSSYSISEGTDVYVTSDGSNWFLHGIGALPGMPYFGSSLTANGYQKLPSGLIVQWGETAPATTSTVTFPVTFPNKCATGVAVQRSNLANRPCTIENITTSQMVIYKTYSDDSYWIAIGY